MNVNAADSSAVRLQTLGAARHVALVPWGHTIEEFLSSIGVTLDQFCDEMDGGWLFGYAQALQLAGFRVSIVCVSSSVSSPGKRVHQGTGATMYFVPARRTYTFVRRFFQDPYTSDLRRMFAGKNVPRIFRKLLRDLLPYLATPRSRLEYALNEASVDVIIGQEYEYARFDALVAIGHRKKMPVFATFQGGNWQASRFEKWFRPRSMRQCNGLIIGPSDEVDRVVSTYQLPERRICRACNPIDLGQWKSIPQPLARAQLGLPPDARIAVCHGRIDLHRKGLDVLLSAWRDLRVRRAEADWRLILIGSGEDAPALRSQLAAAADPSIQWIDRYVRDRSLLQTWLSAADVYVMASRHEGFPVAPLEAMACGLPVVATQVPGIIEIMGDEETRPGLIVEPGNASALAEAIGTLLGDHERRKNAARHTQARVDRFSLQHVSAQLKEFLLSHDDGPARRQ